MLRPLLISALIGLALAQVKQAIVKIEGTATGSVKFVQEGKEVKVAGEIRGLTPGEHGFHIHALGDLSNGCTSAGPHFNPYNKHHGAPTAQDRHVGDLGNIVADGDGVAKIALSDSAISLSGETSIVGRAVVVHGGKDDLGLGGNEESLKTGNAGARAGCGVVGIFEDTSDGGSLATKSSTGSWGIALAILTFLVTAA